MSYELELIYSRLSEIHINLRKLGPKKRENYKELVSKKIELAESYFKDYQTIVKCYDQGKSELSGYILELVSEKIESIYSKIKSYTNKNIETSKAVIMDKFDIKTAASLVMVMDGKEETTEKIIEGIDMYNSCLKDEDSKALLISFVLKTRLTKIAKLKLKSNYETCKDLITDMKQKLLTRKSANSLLTQLNSITQKDMTISEYATKIEELFVDLTISQAGPNDQAFEILRPINEKLAIKRFSDGLRNRRLSTIISARDYQDLKDAARAAEDEELAQPSSSNVVLSYRGKPISSVYYRGDRGRANYSYRSRGNFHHGQGHFRGSNTYTSRYNGRRPYGNSSGYSRGFSSRPNSYNNRYPRGNQRNVFMAQQSSADTSLPRAETTNIDIGRSQFFRD